jgi:5'(3')-deoxyribonucleotidase
MKVFLDIDGVLANFNKRAYEALSLPYAENLPTTWHWYKNYGLSFEEFDSVCTVDFWEGVQWMSDGREILKAVENKFGRSQIYLCTTLMPNPGSGTGKMRWIERHLPQYKKRFLLMTAPKNLFSGSDCLLIDDKDDNIDEFRTGDGVAITVPRPWNRLSFLLNPLMYVEQELEKL